MLPWRKFSQVPALQTGYPLDFVLQTPWIGVLALCRRGEKIGDDTAIDRPYRKGQGNAQQDHFSPGL